MPGHYGEFGSCNQTQLADEIEDLVLNRTKTPHIYNLMIKRSALSMPYKECGAFVERLSAAEFWFVDNP